MKFAPVSSRKARRSYAAPALTRGLRILEVLARAGVPLTLSEIARSTGRSAVTAKTCWLRSAENDLLSEIEDLHRQTRREIQRSDEFSPAALGALKVLLDGTLARCGRAPRATGAQGQQRLQLAEQWMRRHLDIRAPAAALADYLGLSAMGLHRLFRQSAGLSPGRAFLEIKMREAAVLLRRPETSVKETALALGYRHPGDFTRTYTKFHGKPPSRRS